MYFLRRSLRFLVVALGLTACSQQTPQTVSAVGSHLAVPPTVLATPNALTDPSPTQSVTPVVQKVWMLQDLSVLFPLPQTLPNPNAIRPSDQGKLGAFVPDALLQKLPLLEPNLSLATQTTRLELVAVRFDPPQVRLIWQVFKTVTNADGKSGSVAFDTAVHSFYQVSDTNGFISDLAETSALAQSNLQIDAPLTVHPTLMKKGFKSDYAQSLQHLISKWCGESNLFKLTFMVASGEHLHWTFGGFTYANGEIQTLQIPKINLTGVQTFSNSSPSAASFLGGIDVIPDGQTELDAILKDSSNAMAVQSDSLEKAHFTAVTLENPRLTDVDQTDCASCHVAQMVRLWVEDRTPSLTSEFANVFTSSQYPLTNVSADKDRSDNLRAFGYFADQPAVSQRTINDSALIASRLSGTN